MNNHKFKKGDTIKCVQKYGMYNVGNVITITGYDGTMLRYTEDERLLQVSGYTWNDDIFVLPYDEECFWELDDGKLPYDFEMDYRGDLERFMSYLSKQDNLSDFEFQLVRRYEWFKREEMEE